MTIVDSQTAHELRCLEEIDGKLKAPEGEFDDCAMAAGLACMGMKKLVRLPKPREVRDEKPKIDYTKPILPWANLDEAAKHSYEVPRWR